MTILTISACRKEIQNNGPEAVELNPLSISAPNDLTAFKSGDSIWIQAQSADTGLNTYTVSVYSETEGSMLFHRVFYADADIRQMPKACWISHVHVSTLATLRIKALDRLGRQYSSSLRLLINP